MNRLLLRFTFILGLALIAAGAAQADSWSLGMREFGAGNFVAAARHFRTYVNKNPKFSGGHYMLGRCLLHLGQTEDAINELSTAFKALPSEPKFSVWLASAYLDSQEYSRALKLATVALSLPMSDQLRQYAQHVQAVARSKSEDGSRPANPREAKLKELFEKSKPTCSGEADCKVKWDAAQLWVIHNAGFKIQNITDVLIETYNPTKGSPNLAAMVTKEPKGKGRYEIDVTLTCANDYGCTPDVWKAGIDFNRTVAAAKP